MLEDNSLLISEAHTHKKKPCLIINIFSISDTLLFYVFIHQFIQETLIEHLLCAQH